MGKGEKKGKSAGRRFQSESEEEQQQNREMASQIEVAPIVVSDEDDEANEDLSLKIVERAMLRKSLEGSKIDAGNFVVLEGDELVTNVADDKIGKKESKRKKRKKIQAELEPVDAVKEEKKVESEKTGEVVDEAVEVSENPVLRMLLRGPRYFDPHSSWGTCYNCGEEGHMSINCTSAKRKKPCFVCGSLEHDWKQCTKGHDCYICNKGGHRAKDCPENRRKGSRNPKICLKCGYSGHDMFSCENDYLSDDLKEIECYVCGSTGHLCCVNYTDMGPKEITCYRCGLSGHTGLACKDFGKNKAIKLSVGSCYSCGGSGHFARECTNSSEACKDFGKNKTIKLSVGSCYSCGGSGHFARECTNSSKGGKRKSELYTPKRRHSKENRDHIGVESAPRDVKTQRKSLTKLERRFSSASKSNGKYGWLTEDPGDLTSNEAKASGHRSPATPNNKRFRMPDYSASDHASTSYSSSKSRSFHYNSSASKGSGTFNRPRYASWNSDYSASYGLGTHHNRFASWKSGNSTLNGSAELHHNSNFGTRRNYKW